MKRKYILYTILILALFVLILSIKVKSNNRKMVHELCEAIKVDDEVAIEEYMSKSTNINTIYRVGGDAYAETPLSVACGYGRFELVKRMVLEKNADVNYVPEEAATPVSCLFSFSGEKHTLDEYIEIYDFLIGQGADIKENTPLRCFGYSFLLKKYISNLGEDNTIKLIDYILESGAEYADSQMILSTVLINNIKILRYLIENKEINIIYDEFHDSLALCFAADELSYECAEYLMSIGFRQDIVMHVGEYKGMSALEIAEAKGDERMIKILKKQ